MGIDCSTRSLAWATFDCDQPVECGEFMFMGSDLYERLNSARQVTQSLVDSGSLIGDYVGIESAVYVSNMQSAIKLAYVFGAVMSVLMQNKMHVIEVAPISWQTAIGNPNLKKDEKELIRKNFPNQSESWYKNKGRELRKSRTLTFAKQFFDIPGDSDNVGDAVGIAWTVSNNLTKRELDERMDGDG